MGGYRKFKKGQKGENQKFMTRNEAIKKLQISLKVFRKLCIIKGVHPRDPRKKLKGKSKTYYYAKDIRFLQHEHLLDVIRARKAVHNKEIKLIARGEFGQLKALKNNRPMLSLDHIVRERYPTFEDALKDLDDALSLMHLFAVMDSSPKVRENHILTCERLCREFQYYVAKSGSLRKVFISVKGVYYQAEIMGETITWIAPLTYIQKKETEVDYGVMISFLEFYETLLKFVNYRLYTSLGMAYPPKIDAKKLKKGQFFTSIMMNQQQQKQIQNQKSNTTTTTTTTTTATDNKNQIKKIEAAISKISSKEVEVDEDRMATSETADQLEFNSEGVSKDFEGLIKKDGENGDADLPKIIDHANLFKGLKFFLSREVPRNTMEFVIVAFGGKVSYEGGGYPEKDGKITHQIVDRTALPEKIYHTREYVQPQWVLDSINSKILLPISEYAPGVVPPPHLSPFVEYDDESYIPARKAALDKLINQKERYMNELRTEQAKKRKSPDNEEDEDENEDEEDEEDEDEDEEEEEKEEEMKVDQQPQQLTKKERDALKKKQKEEEETKLAELMIKKKDKWLYNRIKTSNQEKQDAKANLMAKRAKIESGKDVNGKLKQQPSVPQQQPQQQPKQQQISKQTSTSKPTKKSLESPKKQVSTKPVQKKQKK
eukprot:gene2010-2473_t